MKIFGMTKSIVTKWLSSQTAHKKSTDFVVFQMGLSQCRFT